MLQLIKVKEVARLLNTTERTVLNKISRKEIPAIRIGRLIRVNRNELADLMGVPRSYKSNALDSEGSAVFEL